MLNKPQDAETQTFSDRAGDESTAARMDQSTIAKIDDARKGRSAKIAQSVIEAVSVGGPFLQVLQLAQGLAGVPTETERESEQSILE